MSHAAAFINKKKIRGWKTQLRRVERWRQAQLTPDWAHFERFSYDYCKIQIDPWNRLIERQPPLWLARRMLHGLLDIHEAWTAQVPDAPYLRLWLNWPHVMDSQVVLAQESRVDWYGDMFRPVAELGWAEAKGFPPQFGPELLERLKAWDWQECLHEYPMEYEARNSKRFKHLPYSSFAADSPYLVEVGRVWVGKRRAA